MLAMIDWLRHRARRRVWHADHAAGRRGEDLAHRFLRARGYVVIARNYRTRSGSGEVDLIGWDGDSLAFIEVKTRQSEEFGPPDRAVDFEKQRRLVLAARDFARRSGIEWERVRFDIVNVVLGEPVAISVMRDAFARESTAV